MDDTHWDLTTTERIKYSMWYCGLVMIFVLIIMKLAHIPGADIGEQFLKS